MNRKFSSRCGHLHFLRVGSQEITKFDYYPYVWQHRLPITIQCNAAPLKMSAQIFELRAVADALWKGKGGNAPSWPVNLSHKRSVLGPRAYGGVLPLNPISFIFIQFSAKLYQIIGRCFLFRVLAHRLFGYPEFAIYDGCQRQSHRFPVSCRPLPHWICY